MIVSLGNVLNPSPAMTTGTFTVSIGNDYSSIGGSSNSIMTLSADTFINCGISFSPLTTNSSGDMIILISPKTGI